MNRTRTPAVLLLVAAAGCDPAPRQPTASPTVADAAAPPTVRTQDPKTTLPRPDPHQIGFDPEARTLTLYELPDRSAQWMLTTPGETAGRPVNAIHRFSDDVDPDTTAVFYTTAGGLPSPRVTLREVLNARLARRD